METTALFSASPSCIVGDAAVIVEMPWSSGFSGKTLLSCLVSTTILSEAPNSGPSGSVVSIPLLEELARERLRRRRRKNTNTTMPITTTGTTAPIAALAPVDKPPLGEAGDVAVDCGDELLVVGEPSLTDELSLRVGLGFSSAPVGEFDVVRAVGEATTVGTVANRLVIWPPFVTDGIPTTTEVAGWSVAGWPVTTPSELVCCKNEV